MVAGNLFIIAAPSGAGKTSLVKALLSKVKHLRVSVSHTTRAMRPGEQTGVDYHYVSPETFRAMVANDEFLEHATVFDRSYGTSRQAVLDQLKRGVDVVLEIDWQGARQVREQLGNCVSIFILPPSREILDERLRARGQDDEATIARRMKEAVSEMTHYDEFDYIIINDDFNEALRQLVSIVTAQRLAAARQKVQLIELIDKLIGMRERAKA